MLFWLPYFFFSQIIKEEITKEKVKVAISYFLSCPLQFWEWIILKILRPLVFLAALKTRLLFKFWMFYILPVKHAKSAPFLITEKLSLQFITISQTFVTITESLICIVSTLTVRGFANAQNLALNTPSIRVVNGLLKNLSD